LLPRLLQPPRAYYLTLRLQPPTDHHGTITESPVKGRRSFDEHVGFFITYGARVAQLSAASWNRMRVRCADLNDAAFRSLLRRAFLAAKPYELWLPEAAQRVRTLRVIAGVSRLLQTSLAIAGEAAAEFEGSTPAAPDQPPRRTQSTGSPRIDAYIDANFLIESMLAPLQRTDPGVTTAVRAAGQAVLRHDWLLRADFQDAYALVEPEIPFADLESPSSGTTA